ncbi:MAG: Fur family transcriptional regulator [Eubacterium sp.]
MQENRITEIFKAKGFRATPQRIAVYKYLCENHTHPTVDDIYSSLSAANPSFSKTTVYNSLDALEKQGLIMSVNIDSERIHYDAVCGLHGHFICRKCKKIFDFNVDYIAFSGLDGFDISKQDVYCSGICPECK